MLTNAEGFILCMKVEVLDKLKLDTLSMLEPLKSIFV